MRTSRRWGCLVVASLLLAACGSGDQERTRAETTPAQDDAYKNMTREMDKARAVEDLTKGRNESLDRQLEQSESPPPPADR